MRPLRESCSARHAPSSPKPMNANTKTLSLLQAGTAGAKRACNRSRRSERAPTDAGRSGACLGAFCAAAVELYAALVEQRVNPVIGEVAARDGARVIGLLAGGRPEAAEQVGGDLLRDHHDPNRVSNH